MSIFIKYVDYKTRESAFKTSDLNSIISVQELKNYVQQEYNIMIDNECDFAIVPNSTHALALQALYDGEVTSYPLYGIYRNTYVFLHERDTIRENVLWIDFENGSCIAEFKDTGNRSVIQYLYEEYGIIRSPMYTNWTGKNTSD